VKLANRSFDCAFEAKKLFLHVKSAPGVEAAVSLKKHIEKLKAKQQVEFAEV
jgi:hypothetical protein